MILLALHGVGGNGRLWDGVALSSRFRTVAPDLAGHGSAPPLPRYSFDDYIEELVPRVSKTIGSEPLVILGHSMGGALGLELASSSSPLDIRGVVTVGVKTVWPPEDKALLHRVADKGVVWFQSEADARERYAKLSGLSGALSMTSPGVEAGVTQDCGRWRFAADPEVFRVAPQPVGAAVQAAKCPVVFAAGEHDGMSPPSTLEGYGPRVVTLEGLGHNAHVEDPEAVLKLLEFLDLDETQ